MTPHLRRGVADAAALVAEAVPHLDEAALWAVLDRLGRIEGIVRNGMLPYGGSATDEARAELRAAVDHIVSRFVSVWESVPLAVRQRLVWFGRGRPTVSERARRDTQLRQFTVFFPARDHGRSHERWLRIVAARARRLAARVPGIQGLRLMEETLTVGQLLGDGPGAYAFVDALALTLAKKDVEDAVTYCVRASHLRGYAAQFLGAAVMRFAPDLDETVVRLVDAADADVIVPRVLDGVQPATESTLLAVLMKRERPPFLEIAEHVERCSRLGPQRKYALLVSICERLSDDSLPRGLTILGTTARASKVHATASLQRRITNQIIRLLSLSEIAHVGFIWFEPLFEMVASWGSDAMVEVVLARVKQLLASGLVSRRGQQRLGKEVLKVVGSLGAEQKRAAAHGLSGWLQTTVENPWGGEDAVYDLLRSTMSADEFTLLAIRWAKGASTLHLAISAIRGRCPSGEFDAVGRVLLGQVLSREEESSLLSAADLHGGMWGPLSPMYRERARFFEGWERDTIPSIRRFGEKARRLFEERATREERQEFFEENR
jgi:hypothetical protein